MLRDFQLYLRQMLPCPIILTLNPSTLTATGTNEEFPGNNTVLIILRDLNTQASTKRELWYPTLHRFGARKENSNGNRLLQFCRWNNLVSYKQRGVSPNAAL